MGKRRRPPGVVGRCADSKKYQYRTRVDALMNIVHIQSGEWWRRKRETPPTDVYYCPECHYWHLTSRTYRENHLDKQERRYRDEQSSTTNHQRYQTSGGRM